VRPLADVTSFLVPDQRDRPPFEAREPGDDGRIVPQRAVAVQLDEVVANAFDVVERVRAVLMTGELDRAPYLVLRRLRRDALDLALQASHLVGHAHAAQKRQLAKLRQPLTQSQLFDLWTRVVSRHGSFEQREDAPHERAQLRARDDRVHMAEAAVRLRETKVVR
jgi:hypothetical protein